jgi:hypothetical protein
MYLSFEFQLCFRVAFRLARKRLPIARTFVIGAWMEQVLLRVGHACLGRFSSEMEVIHSIHLQESSG